MNRHSLSLAAGAILFLWVFLYSCGNPATHAGSFFGNAIADWMGVLVAVIATKSFYETGSAESWQPRGQLPTRFRELVRDHSLTIFRALTGIAWAVLYLEVNSESKWEQVAGNILSEWIQLLGLVLMTKRLLELKSEESRPPPPIKR